MVQFALNQTIETAEPAITVDAGLPVGQHRFQLVVTDTAGIRSKPAVEVVDIGRDVPRTPALEIRPGLAPPLARRAVPDSSDAPTTAAPPRTARGSAKKPKRSPPRTPRPPRKEK